MLTWILVVWLLNTGTGRVEVRAIMYPSQESCLKGVAGIASSLKYEVRGRSRCLGVVGEAR